MFLRSMCLLFLVVGFSGFVNGCYESADENAEPPSATEQCSQTCADEYARCGSECTGMACQGACDAQNDACQSACGPSMPAPGPERVPQMDAGAAPLRDSYLPDDDWDAEPAEEFDEPDFEFDEADAGFDEADFEVDQAFDESDMFP